MPMQRRINSSTWRRKRVDNTSSREALIQPCCCNRMEATQPCCFETIDDSSSRQQRQHLTQDVAGLCLESRDRHWRQPSLPTGLLAQSLVCVSSIVAEWCLAEYASVLQRHDIADIAWLLWVAHRRMDSGDAVFSHVVLEPHGAIATGPNMSGKSTLMRAIGRTLCLLALLAF